MIRLSTRSATGFLLPVLAALLACGDGGANMGQRAPGDQPGGVMVGIGDLAVAPSDAFVVFENDDGLAVGWTESGKVAPLPASAPTRLAFSKQRQVVYVGSLYPSDKILAIDVESREALWTLPIADASTERLRLVSTADDSRLVAVDVTNGLLHVIRTDDGSIERTMNFGAAISDVQILPDDRRALVTLRHTWAGAKVSTRVVVVTLDTGSMNEISVPNCSDRPAVSGDGKRAFLAPTTCVEPRSSSAKDPISLIDLDPAHESFVRNLPGFGPVRVSPSGTMAVGFLDRLTVDRAVFDDPNLIPASDTARYHLMLLDTETLAYEFVEAGNRLPRFAVTPDGNVLLVDSSWTADVPARLFDVAAGAWKFIDGAPLLLDNFVVTSDSQHAYVIESRFYEGFYDLDIGQARSSAIPLDFSPRNINVSPSDEVLYLREDDSTVCVFSIAEQRCTSELVAPSGER